MSKINGLNINNIIIVKNGEIYLTSDYNEAEKIGFPCHYLTEDLTEIKHDFKKATKNNYLKLMSNKTSFYISTNKRVWDNSIIYDLYINEDICKAEYLSDCTKKGIREGTTDHQRKFKLTFSCELVYNPYKWVDITEKEYNELINYYENVGYWDAKIKLMEERFSYKIERANAKLKKATEKNNDMNYYNAVIRRSEEAIKNGFYAMTYKKVEQIRKEIEILSFVYKTEKDEHAKRVDKLTEIMKLCNKNISYYDVEKMLNYFNISIKRGKNGKEN